MISELTRWWDKYHFDEVAFQDETFFTSRARVEEIAEAFISAKLERTETVTAATWM